MLGALRRLPARQREALVLRFYLDLSRAEIAAGHGDRPGHRQIHHVPGALRPRAACSGRTHDTRSKTASGRRPGRPPARSHPDSAPPLRLPGANAAGDPRPVPRRHRAGWHRLAPLAAAAAVTAVVAASLAISTAFHGGHRAARGPASPFAGVPPYYIVLTGKKPQSPPSSPAAIRAEVRATATGAVAGPVTPPPPYGTFSAAAAGDGRTFVLAANKWKMTRADRGTAAEATATKFFLLRLAAGGRPSG